MRMVRNFSAKSNGTIRIFLQVATADANEMLEMTNLGSRAKSPHIVHGGTENIVATKRDFPLETANQCLVLFYLFGTRFISHVELFISLGLASSVMMLSSG